MYCAQKCLTPNKGTTCDHLFEVRWKYSQCTDDDDGILYGVFGFSVNRVDLTLKDMQNSQLQISFMNEKYLKITIDLCSRMERVLCESGCTHFQNDIDLLDLL